MYQNVIADLKTLLAEGRTLLSQIEKQKPTTYLEVVRPFDALSDRLTRFWAPISHLNAVKNSPELREVYEAGVQLLTDFHTEVGQNEALFQAYTAVRNGPEWSSLTGPQQKVVEHALRDFRLAGIGLAPAEKKRFKAIEAQLSEEATRFEQHLMDAIDAWQYHTEKSEDLAGLPAHLLTQAQQRAQEKGLAGYVLGIDAPTYMMVSNYAQNRELRAHFYRAYVTRASDLGEKSFDNSENMVRILQLRQEQAALLGFATYADYAFEGKMAPSVTKVIDFLADLTAKTRPFAEAEWQELQDFAATQGFVGSLEAYDVGFYAEALKAKRFGFSEEDLRPYLPISKVLAGLFTVLFQVFGLSFKKVEREAWHPDVEYFEVYNEAGELAGGIYMDLYARAKKRSGAWMDECQGRYFIGKEQHPIAYLTCNFLSGGDHEACLTHDDVVTLFHEMGHVLHHVLTQVDEPQVAGISGVAWDAVEFPSQFLEHFAWQREVLASLPQDLYAQLWESRRFQGGLQMLRQLEFALFDLRLHQTPAIKMLDDITHILNEVRGQVAVILPPAYNRFAHSFSHIFAGGYAAGYYSYKWAEVLSADAFSHFEEEGVLSRALGLKFRQCILEKGGSEDAMALFVAFRGREPTIDALLKEALMRYDSLPTCHPLH